MILSSVREQRTPKPRTPVCNDVIALELRLRRFVFAAEFSLSGIVTIFSDVKPDSKRRRVAALQSQTLLDKRRKQAKNIH